MCVKSNTKYFVLYTQRESVDFGNHSTVHREKRVLAVYEKYTVKVIYSMLSEHIQYDRAPQILLFFILKNFNKKLKKHTYRDFRRCPFSVSAEQHFVRPH